MTVNLESLPCPDAKAADAMEHVLEAYHRPHGPALPLVCVDETSKQLASEPRKPIPAALGRAARFDYEYQRNDQSVHDVRTGAGGESG